MKKSINIEVGKIQKEEINKIQNDRKKEVNTKKEDQTDKLLDISYANEIFSKNNPKYLKKLEFLE